MRLRSVLLLAGTPLFAQFSQFVATDDGKQVYFTSPLVLYSSPASQNAESRLYRIGLDGVFLVAQRPQASTPVWFSGSGDGVSDPQVSGDGSLVGFTYRNLCPAAQNPCQSPIPAEAQLTGAQTADLGRGVLQLSRNGRWALLADQLSNPFPGATYTYALTDLATGQLTHLPQSLFVPARAIASDGSVLFLSSIWKQG